ncbi:MAG: hypothetical protein CMJ59_02855 [Planctomycetaceae bacterium]|nr:hypothetical protein [Planctomycetaceae bacterium]
MAKKSTAKVNKSQSIRDYLAKKKNARPAEIVEALGKQGIVVSAQFVSTIKTGLKRGKGKPSRGAGGKRKAGGRSGRKQASAGHVTVAQLLQVRTLAERMGGVSQLRAALDALEQLGLS